MQDVTIFYLAFDIETYVPVTIDSIDKYPRTCQLVIPGSSKEAEILRRAIENLTNGNFDNTVVRVKVSGLVEQELFVDRDGGVLLGRGGIEKQIARSDFDVIGALMESLAKKHRCDEGK